MIKALVHDTHGEECSVLIPDSELATILPRSILVAEAEAPVALLTTIRATVATSAFYSWRSMRFAAPEELPLAATVLDLSLSAALRSTRP